MQHANQRPGFVQRQDLPLRRHGDVQSDGGHWWTPRVPGDHINLRSSGMMGMEQHSVRSSQPRAASDRQSTQQSGPLLLLRPELQQHRLDDDPGERLRPCRRNPRRVVTTILERSRRRSQPLIQIRSDFDQNHMRMRWFDKNDRIFQISNCDDNSVNVGVVSTQLQWQFGQRTLRANEMCPSDRNCSKCLL